MKQITTVVFDLDDTLYDEQDYYKSGFAVVAEHISKFTSNVNTEEIFTALWEQFEAKNYNKVFNAALDRLGINYDDKFISQLVTIFRNHKPSIILPAETKSVLDVLSKRYILGIITDGFLPAQKLKVKALDIEKYFQHIVYTEELGREFWKPSTKGFEVLMEILNIDGENCVYIGDDASKDFIGPNKLGFTTIQIIRPRGIHTAKLPNSEAAAVKVIYSLSELPEILDKLQSEQ